MAWDVSKQASEINHTFEKAIPKDAATWVRIDKVRPGANAIMEATLSEATLIYRGGEVQQRQTVHWELLKFTACWLTCIETNLEDAGRAYFPTRRKRHEEVSKVEFANAWNKVLPLELTDEWMAAVLAANPIWYETLRLWVPLWWLRQWMPEKLEEKPDGDVQGGQVGHKVPERSGVEAGQKAQVKEEVTLGED